MQSVSASSNLMAAGFTNCLPVAILSETAAPKNLICKNLLLQPCECRGHFGVFATIQIGGEAGFRAGLVEPVFQNEQLRKSPVRFEPVGARGDGGAQRLLGTRRVVLRG